MVDFIVKHPNIGAAISFHTHSGVILRPMGTQSDDDMTPEDLWVYKRLSALGTKLTGYPAISIHHDFKYHPKEIITGTQDWVYEHLGALFWTVELWAPNREAGITDYDWIHWYREHPPEDDLKLLKWSDEQCARPGARRLVCVPAPAAGRGGTGRLGQDELLAQPAAGSCASARRRASRPGWRRSRCRCPSWKCCAPRCVRSGEDTWRVRFAVANAGYLPAYISKRALERKVARGVVFNIHLPHGASLVSGAERIVGPQLEGHAPKISMQAFLPNPGVTADRAVAEWVVRGPRGARIGLSAVADRAGAVRCEVSLD